MGHTCFLGQLETGNDTLKMLEISLSTRAGRFINVFGVGNMGEHGLWDNVLTLLVEGLAGTLRIAARLGESGKDLFAGERDLFTALQACSCGLSDLVGIASRVGDSLQEVGRDDVAALVTHVEDELVEA